MLLYYFLFYQVTILRICVKQLMVKTAFHAEKGFLVVLAYRTETVLLKGRLGIHIIRSAL